MFNRKRKVKAMVPQTETVELPDIVEPVQENDGWMFPRHWSDECKRDWLVTHPTTQVETINVDPETPSEDDRDEYEKTYDQQQADVAAEMKAGGTFATAMALPPELRDVVTEENYDPRDFILVHHQVWTNFLEAVQSEKDLTEENRQLRKRVNALTRGMRKVNKHWSATKRELKQVYRDWAQSSDNHNKAVEDMESLWQDDRKRAVIFATRLARRLRKARAGRDKRERQMAQLQQNLKHQDIIVASQNAYIEHLENLISPRL
jgi:hypothetical protein